MPETGRKCMEQAHALFRRVLFGKYRAIITVMLNHTMRMQSEERMLKDLLIAMISEDEWCILYAIFAVGLAGEGLTKAVNDANFEPDMRKAVPPSTRVLIDLARRAPPTEPNATDPTQAASPSPS